MRLFVGIELPDSLRQSAGAAAEDLRRGLSSVAPSAKLRWVDTSNLHITLWFLGEVADDRAPDIARAIGEPYETTPFTLRLAGAGMFPPSGLPRALWFGLQAGGESLRQVHGELKDRMVPLGFEAEKREYAAHMTIARFKEVRRTDVAAIRTVIRQSHADIGECRIRAVTLFRSRLSPKGAQYESLLRVPLKG
jgi:2'-5' RNA ligase